MKQKTTPPQKKATSGNEELQKEIDVLKAENARLKELNTKLLERAANKSLDLTKKDEQLQAATEEIAQLKAKNEEQAKEIQALQITQQKHTELIEKQNKTIVERNHALKEKDNEIEAIKAKRNGLFAEKKEREAEQKKVESPSFAEKIRNEKEGSSEQLMAKIQKTIHALQAGRKEDKDGLLNELVALKPEMRTFEKAKAELEGAIKEYAKKCGTTTQGFSDEMREKSKELHNKNKANGIHEK